MPEYDVEVIRIGYAHRIVRVTSPNANDAEEDALMQAGNFLYKEHHSEYEIADVQKVPEVSEV